MMGVSLAAVFLTQADKLLLSKLLSLSDFGRYALAGVVASALYVLLTPVFNSVYPKMAAMVASGDEAGVLDLYRSGTRLLCVVLFPLSMTMAVFSGEIITLWTGDAGLANSVAPIAAFLLLGSACNGVMHFPYALQLSHGNAKVPLALSSVMALLMVPVLLMLTMRFGPVGSAAAWFIMNASYVAAGTWITHRKWLTGWGARWLLCDVGGPFASTAAVLGLGWLCVHGDNSPTHRFFGALGIGAASIVVNFLLLPAPSRRKVISAGGMSTATET
jgi:O-antigen/teichoic acid export membrane protein